LSPFLSKLFQQSVDFGELPLDWKVANVCPIYKSGCHKDPANYRPVSVTSIVSKTLEHIIYSNIMAHLNKESLITDTQHGFRQGRSCETQLAMFVHEIQSTLDKGKEIDAIFLDFAKAFDTVPHQRLLLKLKSFGINENIVSWIAAFLSGRQQRVVVDGAFSTWVDVTSGVPQGSVLGPLLFLIFINDLPRALSCSLKLFADDSAMYSEVERDEGSFSATLQSDLKALDVWCKTWQLKLNKSKCYVMRISRRRVRTVPTYSLDGVPLTVVNSVKYLGIHITHDLRWNEHICKIVGLASQRLRFVQRIFRNCPEIVKETGYVALVRPLLEYCAPVWSPHVATQIDTIEMVQRRAARFVKGVEKSMLQAILKDVTFVNKK